MEINSFHIMISAYQASHLLLQMTQTTILLLPLIISTKSKNKSTYLDSHCHSDLLSSCFSDFSKNKSLLVIRNPTRFFRIIRLCLKKITRYRYFSTIVSKNHSTNPLWCNVAVWYCLLKWDDYLLGCISQLYHRICDK